MTLTAGKNKCDKCLEKANILYKQTKRGIEDQGRYVSIIGSVFYVSLITFFCCYSEHISSILKARFIINYIISVSVFVLNEIIRMVQAYIELNFNNNEWCKFYNSKLSLQEVEKNINIHTLNLYKYSFTFWLVVFSISIITGILALYTLLQTISLG